jgi:hypothetical protein
MLIGQVCLCRVCVANLIYKPLVLEPGVLILVDSFQQQRKRLAVVHIPGKDQPGDMLTK